MRAQPLPQPIEPGVVRFYNFLPDIDNFGNEVLEGLSRTPKSLAAKNLHDERGSRLFEALCVQPEYYPAAAELEILRDCSADMAQFVGRDIELIEWGGAGAGTPTLIHALQPLIYVPVHSAEQDMRVAVESIAEYFPALHVMGIFADCSRPVHLPEFVGMPIRRKILFSSGVGVDCYPPDQTLALLKQMRNAVGVGGMLLIGVDLKKERKIIEAACNDAQGAAARFNLNLLARINRELRGDFQEQRFLHKATYNPVGGWVEMRLQSQYAQVVHVDGQRFDFEVGESILTATTCKYTSEEFQELAKKAGFSPEKVWTDSRQWYSVQGMIAI